MYMLIMVFISYIKYCGIFFLFPSICSQKEFSVTMMFYFIFLIKQISSLCTRINIICLFPISDVKLKILLHCTLGLLDNRIYVLLFKHTATSYVLTHLIFLVDDNSQESNKLFDCLRSIATI